MIAARPHLAVALLLFTSTLAFASQAQRGSAAAQTPPGTIMLEVDASVARARRRNLAKVATQQGGEPDENRFEQENRAFFTRVHNAYLAIARRDPQRVLMVDARRQPDVVHGEIAEAVRARFLGTAKSA